MSRSRPRSVRSSRDMHASAPQQCALDCGRSINVGDPIIRTRRGYAHRACVERERGE